MFRFVPVLGLLLSLLWPAILSYGHGAATDYEDAVVTMYIAYYGRPGDPDGVDFWAEKLEQAEGDLAAIINSFGNSDEYNKRFAGLNNDALVNNIYQQLFGRDADTDGRNFYVGKLQSGELNLASIALDIYRGVQNEDALIVANKLTVAHSFTDHIADNGLSYGADEINDAKDLLGRVDASDASLVTAATDLTDLFALDAGSSCTQFEGSFERIQSIIFDGYNCTNSACHGGSGNTGNLDLSANVAYQNLFRVDASASLTEPTQLVYPGEQGLSFLFQKLAAGTEGTSLPDGGGQAMPFGGAALTEDHLEAMRLWIRAGAPEFTDVDDVATLLGCSVGTAPKANKILPPPAPVIGEGVQFVSGPWTVETNSEDEVCFATYYDLEKIPGALPDWAKVDCSGGAYNNYDGECFAYNKQAFTQDPQSHHSIISSYVGATSPLDSAWGQWQCLNGPSAGMACDPTRIGEPVSEGGADCGGDLYACGTPAQSSFACTGWGARDHRQLRVSMGGAQSPVSNNNFTGGVYSVMPSKGVIIWNSHAFNLTTEDTTVEQYNNFYFAAGEERKHRNRAIFDSKDIFIANVPPYQERTYCSTTTIPVGSRLTELGSHAHKRGVLWQTWLPPQDPTCKTSTACTPNTEPADYVSKIYNDPLVITYDPPLEYDSSNAADRTIKFCLTYDNGLNFPELLKRNSLSVGSKCGNGSGNPLHCIDGVTPGQVCSDDSECGDGGVCDACNVWGGATTEDEMMILLGSYYLVPVE
jgi:hypothetical protein